MVLFQVQTKFLNKRTLYAIKVNDYSWSGCLTSDNSFVITGMVAGTTIGDGSIFLAKLGQLQSNIEKNKIKNLDYTLSQNYPNPFNSGTQISYSLSSPNYVELTIYDILGKEIYRVVDEFQTAGEKSVYVNAEKLSSGIYYYKLQIGDMYSETKKMTLLR